MEPDWLRRTAFHAFSGSAERFHQRRPGSRKQMAGVRPDQFRSGSALKTTSDRVLSVLALFTREKSDWTVEEAAAAIGVPVSTAYRYFRSLSSAELIMPYLQGRYVLGSAIIEYDYAMRLHDPLLAAAHKVVADLADTVGECDAMLARLYK